MPSLLVIPFYKNEIFIENIGRYFLVNPSEMDLFSEILIINDCPDSEQSAYLEERSRHFGFHCLQNDENIGFLRTANIGIKKAAQKKQHIIILNSDTIPSVGCFSELLSVFDYDEMVGCSCPRSNNATIANLWQSTVYADTYEDGVRLTQQAKILSSKLPKLAYVPTANGFCFAIRNTVAQNFEGFDEAFVPAYEEENEFCLRVSQSGYRIAIANWSFVTHLEGRSFSLKAGRGELMQDHYKMILEKYPFYPERIQQYFASLDVKALHLLGVDSRKDSKESKTVLIDGRTLRTDHNGTMKLICDVVRQASESGYSVDLIAPLNSVKHHKLNSLKNLTIIDSPQKFYDLGIKIGQPFEMHSLLTVPLHSKVAVNIFFDTIALDCIQIYEDSINQYWGDLDDLYSAIIFISEHSKDQFVKRFSPKKAECISLLLPIDLDLLLAQPKSIVDWKYTFVVGNNFVHKGMKIALQKLPYYSGHKYVALFRETDLGRDDILFYPPGELTDEDIASLYQNCEKVIFPTFSEGFGYPLVEALRYGKKIICRPLKPFVEIFSELPERLKALVTFSTTLTPEDIQDIAPMLPADLKTQDEKNYFELIVEGTVPRGSKIDFDCLRQRLKTGNMLVECYSKSH
jgi:hypothetical protein